MPFTAESTEAALVVKVHAQRLDAHLAPAFKAKLNEMIQQGHASIVLDLSEVAFMDSSGIGALVSGLKNLGGRGELVVCGTPPKIVSLFQLTRLDKLFRMFGTTEEALTALAAQVRPCVA